MNRPIISLTLGENTNNKNGIALFGEYAEFHEAGFAAKTATISPRCKNDYPGSDFLKVSHSTISRAICVRGGLENYWLVFFFFIKIESFIQKIQDSIIVLILHPSLQGILFFHSLTKRSLIRTMCIHKCLPLFQSEHQLLSFQGGRSSLF